MTALKTVSMYLRAAKTEAEQAGESTEGMADSVSELRKEILALTGNRVDIQLDSDTFKSTYQIIGELSKVWEDLSDISQASLLEQLGGKRNANVVTAMLTNFDTAEAVLKTAAESAGSALAENEKYLDSINGKIAQFQAAFQALSAETVSSDLVKGVVDTGTSAIEVLTSIIEKLGTIRTLIVAITAAGTIRSGAKGNNFGLLGLVDGEIELDPSGIKGFISGYNQMFDDASRRQVQFISKINTSNPVLSKYLQYLKDVKKSSGEIKTYTQWAENLNLFPQGFAQDQAAIQKIIDEFVELRDAGSNMLDDFALRVSASNPKLGAYLGTLDGGAKTYDKYKKFSQQAGTSVQEFGNKSRAASVALTLLNTAINIGISLFASWLINAAVQKIDSLIHWADEAQERAEELNGSFEDFQKTNKENAETLESLRDEFNELSLGVDRHGENIALTADEYERYQEIIKTILGIAPELEGYYEREGNSLRDKNSLLERALDLNKQNYEMELKRMALTANLATGMGGAVATYGQRVVTSGNSSIDLFAQLGTLLADPYSVLYYDTLLGADEYAPEFNFQVHLSEQILRALGVEEENIADALREFLSGSQYDWEAFQKEYAAEVSENISQIVSFANVVTSGYNTQDEFDAAAQGVMDSASLYLDAMSEMDQANKMVASELQIAAKATDGYDDLAKHAQDIIDEIIEERYNVENMSIRSGNELIPDEMKIVRAKSEIQDLVQAFSDPTLQNLIDGSFSLSSMFDAGDVNVGQYLSTVNKVIYGLEEAGFDNGETSRYMRLSLDTDMVTRQVETIVGAMEDQIDAAERIGALSKEDLTIGVKIVQKSDGPMSFDDLLDEIGWEKIRNAPMVDVLDFSEMITGLDEAKDGLDGIISAMDKLREGTLLSKEELAKLALQYPKLLEQSDLFTASTIDGQKQILDTVLSTQETIYDAQLDEKIAELKAAEQVINDQLELETEKANLIGDIRTISDNNDVSQKEILVNKISELNDLQGRNYVSEQQGELKVNEEALSDKLDQEDDYKDEATKKIWEPYADTIVSAHTEGYGGAIQATENFGNSLFGRIRKIASNVWSSIKNWWSDSLESGGLKNPLDYFKEALFPSGSGNSIEAEVNAGITLNVSYNDNDEDWEIGGKKLTDWVSEQEEASEERIAALEKLKAQYVSARENLESLKGLDLTGIYGNAGSGKSSNDNDTDDTFDWIETRLDRLQRLFDKLKNVASSAYNTIRDRFAAMQSELTVVTKQLEVQQQAYDRYMQEANAVGLPDALAQKVRDGSVDIESYGEETAKLINSYQDWYEKALDCAEAIDELHDSLAALYEERFEDVQEEYNRQLELLEHLTNTFDTGMDELEARGYLASAQYYAAMQDVERQNIDVMRQQLAGMIQALSEAMASGEIEQYSESWYSMQTAINGVKEALAQANVNLLEYAKSMREVEWEHFDYLQDRISQLTQEADFLIELLSHSDLYGENGELTDKGMATLGLHAQNYNVYMAQADRYAQEILNIDRQLANDPYNSDLIERREELLGLQQDMILAAEDEKQAMADLVKEGIETQLDALKKLIDAYKDGLDSAKDLYEYQKKVEEQAANIAALQKQLAALEGDTSEENRARLQELRVSLAEAQEDLEETQYDKYVSDTKKLLDDLYAEYESLLNSRMDNIDALILDMIGTVNANAGSINETLLQASDEVGYNMTQAMRDVWARGGSAYNVVAMYGDNFTSLLTSINQVLSAIQVHVAAMVSASNSMAGGVIGSASTTTQPNVVTPQTSTKPSSPAPSSPKPQQDIGVGSTINAGSAQIYDYPGDPTGERQWFRNDPYYIVVREQDGWLLTRWYKLTSGLTGLFKKSDILQYKTGGLVDYTGLAKVDGKPGKPELMLNARDTQWFLSLRDSLRRLSQQDLTSAFNRQDAVGALLPSLANINGPSSSSNSATFGDIRIDIDHVLDYDDLVSKIKTDKQFERMMQAMITDPMMGKGSMGKYKVFRN